MADTERNDIDENEDGAASGGFVRAARWAVIIFLLLMILIALASYLGGDSSTLPLDYDGFD